MGLVEPRQGSGLFVQDDPLPLVTRALTLSVAPEQKSVGHLFEFRGVLESFAADNAARRRTAQQARQIDAAAKATAEAGDDIRAFGLADSAFHRAVYEAADNPYLSVTASAIRELQREVAHLFRSFPGSIKLAAEQHEKIAGAIESQDSSAAAAAMTAHVTYTSRTVDEIIQRSSDRW
jgi:DNA-binding FadR family transcriptional regulator